MIGLRQMSPARAGGRWPVSTQSAPSASPAAMPAHAPTATLARAPRIYRAARVLWLTQWPKTRGSACAVNVVPLELDQYLRGGF